MLLYKFRAFEQLEYLLDIVFNERLYCPEYKNLNDPFEGMFYQKLAKPWFFSVDGPVDAPLVTYRTEKSIEQLLLSAEHTRVCSLTSDVSDVRLWSLYAGGHSGVAVEIDFSELENQVTKVQYKGSLPEYYESLLSAPTSKEILSFKTEPWEYESEYRVITNSPWFEVRGRIRRLVVGNRCSRDRVELLKRIVPSEIPITHAQLDFGNVRVLA